MGKFKNFGNEYEEAVTKCLCPCHELGDSCSMFVSIEGDNTP